MYSGSYDSGNGGIFIVAIIVILLGGWGIGAAKCGGADHHSAEKEFKSWAKSLGLEYKGEVLRARSDHAGFAVDRPVPHRNKLRTSLVAVANEIARKVGV
jgi:hypothetical protein